MPQNDPKPKQVAEFSTDEWDFRRLSKNVDLATVTEYEYLRSSKLRDAIVKWQSRLFGNTILTKGLWHIRLLRRAKLVEVSDTSPLGRFEEDYGDPLDQVDDETSANRPCPASLRKDAERQMRELLWTLTTGQAIRKLLEMDPAALGDKREETHWLLDSAFKNLENELPEEVKKAQAEWVCLVFDGFPKPWLQLEREEKDPNYFRRRVILESMETEAVTVVQGIPIAFERGTPLPGVNRHCFIVNWNYRPDAIIKRFAKWVRNHHPGRAKGPPEHTGWLKQLSAYRLLEVAGLKPTEAWGRTGASLGAEANWDAVLQSKEPTEWYKQAGEAKRDLDGDFVTKIRQVLKDQPKAPGAKQTPSERTLKRFPFLE